MIDIASGLFDRKYRDNRIFLYKGRVAAFAEDVVRTIYPQLNRVRFRDKYDLEIQLRELEQQLRKIIHNLRLASDKFKPEEICHSFFLHLPELEATLDMDAMAIYNGDPAANSLEEVILCYPGFYAIAIYRMAHEFYQKDIPLLPRLLCEHAHEKTGIEIHPGAKIGGHFVIDHGTGIVIGETTEIGNNVKIYQGVTLGALSVEKGLVGKKRHPTIKDNCIIYSNATILGGKTVIGENSVVGGNVWITESVEPNSLVYHKTEVLMKSTKTPDKR